MDNKQRPNAAEDQRQGQQQQKKPGDKSSPSSDRPSEDKNYLF